MPSIVPSIVLHEIPTYPHLKYVRQWLRSVDPRKAAAIKGEVGKFSKLDSSIPSPS